MSACDCLSLLLHDSLQITGITTQSMLALYSEHPAVRDVRRADTIV